MDRSQPAMIKTARMDPAERQAQVRAQRQAWLTEQKQQLINNQAIPPRQKQQMIARLDRAMAANNAPQGTSQAQRANAAADRQAQIQGQQKRWIEARMEEVRNNPRLHPMHKQQQLDHLQRTLDNMQTATQHNQGFQALIPAQENSLIKSNRQKLTEMFFPDM